MLRHAQRSITLHCDAIAAAPGMDLVAIVAALTTTSVHRGSILPAARVIVLGVPLTFAFLYWLLIVRNRNRPK